ncbi:hypothetical protein DFJ73DRAFT_762798 [Zopfochytrium polystomum]|nr:hypothetical protein DFJ73DRAFT_762798 [Zopfochytrium polystomum]
MSTGSQGFWTTLPVSTGVVGIHAALLPNAKILLWERFHGLHAPSLYPPNPNTFVPAIGQSEIAAELNLGAPSAAPAAAVPKHVAFSPFCAGAVQMEDGSILIAGGDGDNVGAGYIRDGRQAVRRYDPAAAAFTDIGTLNRTRWYPTVTALPAGRFAASDVLVVGGHSASYLPADPDRSNPTMELWGEGRVKRVWDNVDVLVGTYPYNSYPLVYVLPSNQVSLFAGTKVHSPPFYALLSPKLLSSLHFPPPKSQFSDDQQQASLFDLSTFTTRPLPPLLSPALAPSRSFPYLSPAVLLPFAPDSSAAAIMVCGGTVAATNAAAKECSYITVDGTGTTMAGWVDEEPMPVARVMGDAVLLPDGTVLYVNGAQWGTADGPAGHGLAKDPAFEAVLYTPTAPRGSRWRRLAAATIPRLYHSSALLHPDGRVLVFGSDQQNYADPALSPFEYRVEAFSPPYLAEVHSGDPNTGGRLEIVDAPRVARCGDALEIRVRGVGEGGRRVAKVTMVR